MARSHAKILVQVWRDQDWKALTMPAQWLYWVLLSQPKLTLVGSLEVVPGRWAQYANGLTRGDVDRAFDELRVDRVILVDDETDELLIRTFTTHDIDPRRVNVNLARGLWGQWGGIESDNLRREAVWGMPAEVWDKLEPHAPTDAVHIRRSGRLERETGSRSQPQPQSRFEPPPSSHHPTETCRPPAGDASEDPPVDNPTVLNWVERAEAKAAEASRRNLRVVGDNHNHAAGAESHPVHVSAPLTNGGVS